MSHLRMKHVRSELLLEICSVRLYSLFLTIFLLQSTHKLLHQQVRCDGFPTHNHRRRPQYGVDGFPNQGALAVKRKAYRRTRSQGNPFDIHGTQPSDSLHRKACCGPQGAGLLSKAQSAPIPWETLVHRQYLHGRDHVPVNTSSYNSSALAV